jgi:hypothetical protein
VDQFSFPFGRHRSAAPRMRTPSHADAPRHDEDRPKDPASAPLLLSSSNRAAPLLQPTACSDSTRAHALEKSGYHPCPVWPSAPFWGIGAIAHRFQSLPNLANTDNVGHRKSGHLVAVAR